MKKYRIKVVFPIILILLSFIIGCCLYPVLPPNMATHWGINGEVNGYSSKSFGIFFMPILSIFLLILFIILPKTDPYKKNFSEFKKYFQNFVYLIFIFLFYIYLLTLIWNFGITFNLLQFMTPAFTLIFYYAGVLMKNAKRNWFVGIRTPWTLSSDKVWQKTHTLGAKLFKISALISLLSLIYPNLTVYLMIVPILGISFFLYIYSYLVYRK